MTSSPSMSDEVSRQSEASRPRVDSIDLVRGLVIVVMILDHVREFFARPGVDPTNLATTTMPLFFTRWITHFCAPTFIFLAGASAFLTSRRQSLSETSWYLIKRGFLLILLEQTWISVSVFFSYPHFVLALILWVIGWSMIVLAALVHVSRYVIALIEIILIGFHNLCDGFQPVGPSLSLLWGLLHQPGSQTLPGGVPILIGYPLIPWVGVMALGYALGPIFLERRNRRRRNLAALGIGAIVGFLALRWLNVYGDPLPWTVQRDGVWTLASVLNCRKYPPSLLFLLMTLGPTLVALAVFDRGLGKVGKPLRIFGQVPLFVFLLHFPLGAVRK